MRPELISRIFLSCICLAVISAPVYADSTPIQEVITGEATWSGEKHVNGVVIVTGSGTLIIDEGTIIRFEPRDDNGDGIGDSELRVEGTINVMGTEKDRVIFTSASKNPLPADWKYLMINHADDALINYATFEYAFSGVQIHYTKGEFRGLLCRRNIDGFRFSTAPILLEMSVITENENGIRFEERGAGAKLVGNRISGNRVGVFAVVKCRGLTLFSDNIIEDNENYNVKLGERQTEDLPLPGNWWGSTSHEKIEETFFDARLESMLGRVIYRPFLKVKPEDPGSEQ